MPSYMHRACRETFDTLMSLALRLCPTLLPLADVVPARSRNCLVYTKNIHSDVTTRLAEMASGLCGGFDGEKLCC